MEISTRNLRVFGFIWALIFSFLAFKFQYFQYFFGIISIVASLISLLSPHVFLDLKIYQAWIKFGNFLGKINSLIIISILFYALFVPTGFILRLLKKDLLNKKIDRSQISYFTDSTGQINDMKNQF